MIKRALFISDHGDPLAELGGEQSGGQNNYVRQLALAIEKKGIRVDVVTHWSDPEASRIEHFGKHCRVIRITGGHKGYVSKNDMYSLLPDFYAEMKVFLPINEYDLVHTHYWLSGLIGIKLANDYGLPIVHTSHSLAKAKEAATGKLDIRRFNAERRILGSASHVLATTESEKALIKSFVPVPSPITVVPIGVDPAFIIKTPKESRRKKVKPLFAFAGRLEETKGIYTLLRAFHQIVQSTSKAKLIIAGGDKSKLDIKRKLPLEGKLRKAIRGLENHVDFIGPQPQHQLAHLFQHATATVVPSFYESFGMVAAEAQACGSPVIASKVGGLKNVVQNGITGLHVKPGDPYSLASAMQLFLRNGKLSETLGQHAADMARRKFQWDLLVKDVIGIYKEVVNTHGALVGHGLGWHSGWGQDRIEKTARLF